MAYWTELIFVFFAVCLLNCPRLCEGTHECDLFKPLTPGIECLQSWEAVETVTNSSKAWMLLLYASWCGHCQRFAPQFKKLAEDLEAWSPMVKVGVHNCAESFTNHMVCVQFGVKSFPTIRFFRPMDPDPLSYDQKIVGGRSIHLIKYLFIHHLISLQPRPQHWPDLEFVKTNSFLRNKNKGEWIPTVLVFEDESSSLGALLILDLMRFKGLRILRVPFSNVAMVQWYSVVNTPSIVLEIQRGHPHVVSGNETEDPISFFKDKIMLYASNLFPSTHPVVHGSTSSQR